MGTKAPDFELRAMDGKRFVLRDELAHGPLVWRFSKFRVRPASTHFRFSNDWSGRTGTRGCGSSAFRRTTQRRRPHFTKEFGVTFPVLLDDTHKYPVSNAYGLTNVPTIFWIAQDGEIEVSSVGWVKADFAEINRKMAESGKTAPAAVFQPGEDVRDFRAG